MWTPTWSKKRAGCLLLAAPLATARRLPPGVEVLIAPLAEHANDGPDIYILAKVGLSDWPSLSFNTPVRTMICFESGWISLVREERCPHRPAIGSHVRCTLPTRSSSSGPSFERHVRAQYTASDQSLSVIATHRLALTPHELGLSLGTYHEALPGQKIGMALTTRLWSVHPRIGRCDSRQVDRPSQVSNCLRQGCRTYVPTGLASLSCLAGQVSAVVPVPVQLSRLC